MKGPVIEYRPPPKLKKFQPLLPKYFHTEEISEKSEDEEKKDESRVRLQLSSPLVSPKSCPASSPRGMSPTLSSSHASQFDPITQTHSLSLEKSKLFQSLYQLEDHHSKKLSIRARLVSIHSHIQTLFSMSRKAKEMMLAERELLQRLDEQIEIRRDVGVDWDTERREEGWGEGRGGGRMVCGDVSGVMAIFEFGQRVTAHLGHTGGNVATDLPFSISEMSDKAILQRVIPRLSLSSIPSGRGLRIDYSPTYPSSYISIAVALSGYPYPLAALRLSKSLESEEEILIQISEPVLSIAVPAARLHLDGKEFGALTSLDRIKLQRTLQSNLMLQGRQGKFTLLYKSMAFHLGRMFTKLIPMCGEIGDVKIFRGTVRAEWEEFAWQLARGTLQLRNDVGDVTLAVESLSASLRLHVKWKASASLFREESDQALFAFLKQLQFTNVCEAPVTLFKSLELLRCLKPS